MSDDCRTALAIAGHASKLLLTYYKSALQVSFKTDQFDPVTHADRESDAYIRAALTAAFPGDAILSEEHAEQPGSYRGRVWVVDPLDGTKEFVAGRDCFGVIIGLLVDGRPVLGAVHVPARGIVYYAEAGQGAYRVQNGRTTRLRVSTPKHITQAKHFTRHAQPGDIRPIEQHILQLPFAEHIAEGSIGVKLARLASGEAEAFIHTNTRACKWDTIAGELLVREAGGLVTDFDGKPLDYSQAEPQWQRCLAASNSAALHDVILQNMSKTI